MDEASRCLTGQTAAAHQRTAADQGTACIARWSCGDRGHGIAPGRIERSWEQTVSPRTCRRAGGESSRRRGEARVVGAPRTSARRPGHESAARAPRGARLGRRRRPALLPECAGGPLVGTPEHLVGVVTLKQLATAHQAGRGRETVGSTAYESFVHVHPDHPLDVVLQRFAESAGLLPVVSRAVARRVEGVISLDEITRFAKRRRTSGAPEWPEHVRK